VIRAEISGFLPGTQVIERYSQALTRAESRAKAKETAEQALEREDIQNAIEEFQDDVLDEMKKLDPEAEDLLDRLQELAERLMAEQGPPSD
jgi:phage terminase small subunit